MVFGGVNELLAGDTCEMFLLLGLAVGDEDVLSCFPGGGGGWEVCMLVTDTIALEISPVGAEQVAVGCQRVFPPCSGSLVVSTGP